MKKLFFCAAVLCAILTLPQIRVHAQFFKKLKDKVTQAISTPATSTPASTSATNSSGSPVNKTGAGLSNTAPPDIMQGINDAEKANSSADYSNARYSLQQALIGVEIQLGRQILQSLPTTVDGLNKDKDTTKNIVASTQYGWGNMTILTVYSDGKDKQMTITIGNNPAYAGIVNLYFNNAAAMQSNGNNNPNMKQTRVKGNPAVIQFDKSSGYSMFMQMGQSSMIVWSFVNFATEDEVMNAASSFDIDGIKKTMGEQ